MRDVVQDFEAINERVDREGTPQPWHGATLEQNLVDLGWHQKEFQTRRSFAYTVVTPDEGTCLGCVYIDPSDAADAEVRMWVRHSAWQDGLDPILERAVREWVAARWPFERVVYPGRQ